MPTRDTRTHASITIPLSRTRSSTSIRLEPLAARSTGIVISSGLSVLRVPRAPLHPERSLRRRRQRGDFLLELLDLLPESGVGGQRCLPSGSEVPVVTPPIEADRLRLLEGADDEADPDREQLDL